MRAFGGAADDFAPGVFAAVGFVAADLAVACSVLHGGTTVIAAADGAGDCTGDCTGGGSPVCSGGGGGSCGAGDTTVIAAADTSAAAAIFGIGVGGADIFAATVIADADHCAATVIAAAVIAAGVIASGCASGQAFFGTCCLSCVNVGETASSLSLCCRL